VSPAVAIACVVINSSWLPNVGMVSSASSVPWTQRESSAAESGASSRSVLRLVMSPRNVLNVPSTRADVIEPRITGGLGRNIPSISSLERMSDQGPLRVPDSGPTERASSQRTPAVVLNWPIASM